MHLEICRETHLIPPWTLWLVREICWHGYEFWDSGFLGSGWLSDKFWASLCFLQVDPLRDNIRNCYVDELVYCRTWYRRLAVDAWISLFCTAPWPLISGYVLVLLDMASVVLLLHVDKEGSLVLVESWKTIQNAKIDDTDDWLRTMDTWYSWFLFWTLGTTPTLDWYWFVT